MAEVTVKPGALRELHVCISPLISFGAKLNQSVIVAPYSGRVGFLPRGRGARYPLWIKRKRAHL